MKAHIVILCLLAGGRIQAHHADSMTTARLCALADIETGCCDQPPHTRDLSRYGISRPVWREYTSLPFSAATNPVTAGAVATLILADRCEAFRQKQHREPSEAEIYCLWFRPAFVGRMTLSQREKAERFANLVRLYEAQK